MLSGLVAAVEWCARDNCAFADQAYGGRCGFFVGVVLCLNLVILLLPQVLCPALRPPMLRDRCVRRPRLQHLCPRLRP